PELVQLPVGEEVDLAGVRRVHQTRIARGLEVVAVGAPRDHVAHRSLPCAVDAALAGQPRRTWLAGQLRARLGGAEDADSRAADGVEGAGFAGTSCGVVWPAVGAR